MFIILGIIILPMNMLQISNLKGNNKRTAGVNENPLLFNILKTDLGELLISTGQDEPSILVPHQE